jgi:hypothetical protein
MSKTNWERTSVRSSLRNGASGRYYARWTTAGKQKSVNLQTDAFSVAKLRIANDGAKIKAMRRIGSAVAEGRARSPT